MPTRHSHPLRLALACVLVVWWHGGATVIGQRTPDRDFKATVAAPAHNDKHPKVLFDEAHFNVRTSRGSYKTFVDLVTGDRYQVTANDKPFEAKTLEGYDILVMSNASGTPRPSEKPAFTDAECNVVRDWAQGGGVLPARSSTAPAKEQSPSAADVTASDAWPSFRGRSASGVADGQHPPITWSIADDVKGQWKTPIPGLANSSPIVWGDRVFLTTAIATEPPSPSKLRLSNPALARASPVEDQSKHAWCVYCLSLEDGKVVWQQTAHEGEPHVKRHPKSSFANATPVTDGRHMVAFFGSEGLYCYDFNGQLLWKQDLGVIDAAAFDAPGIQWGPASSPIIYDGLVVVQCDQPKDSFLAAYEVATGKPVWRTSRDVLSSWSTPTICQENGRAELVTLSPNSCRGYDPRTGEERWRLGGFSKLTVPTPITANHLIFVCSGDQSTQPIYAIRAGAVGDISPVAKRENGADGALAWNVSRGGPFLPTPIVYGDHLYVLRDNGVLACYEARSGKLLYKRRVEGKGGYSASPVAADGRIYCTSEQGDVSVVKAGPTFELLATNALGERCLATPAISRGKILIRTEHALFGIGEDAERALPCSSCSISAPSRISRRSTRRSTIL